MKLIELRKKMLATLVVVGIAAMLAGCAGTSDSESSSGDDGGCDCAEDDWQCKEDCVDPVF
jgi:hypothetical protein